jgi:hypothetical protein
MTLDPNQSDDEGTIPGELREVLGRMYEPTLSVPAGLDKRILGAARAGYTRRRRWWLAARWCGVGLAAAAAIVLALRVFVANPQTSAPRIGSTRQVARLGDVDHDGHVDILDAYVVARKIARHEPLDPAWDVNGDGVVDQKDVDLIARMAVRVTPEAHQ